MVEMCQSLVFFFQAEDGMRDDLVTGVQTCALPICANGAGKSTTLKAIAVLGAQQAGDRLEGGRLAGAVGAQQGDDLAPRHRRSEERRVVKECRSRWSPYH